MNNKAIPPPQERRYEWLAALSALSFTNGIFGYFRYSSGSSLISGLFAGSVFASCAGLTFVPGYDMYAHGLGYIQSSMLVVAMGRQIYTTKGGFARRVLQPPTALLFAGLVGMFAECHHLMTWMHFNNALPMLM